MLKKAAVLNEPSSLHTSSIYQKARPDPNHSMDKPKAVTAAAHKLARLIYAMLTHGQEYTDRGQDYFEERYRQRVLHNLAQKAKAMGMQLVPSDNTA